MDENAFKEIFSARANHVTEPTPDCPDDVHLASALDGALDPSQQAAFEAHVASCDHCIARLGRIGRLRRADGLERASDISLAKARKMVRKSSLTHHAPRWATAAVVLLAIFSAARIGLQQQDVESTPASASEIRSFDHDAYRPVVLFPSEGVTLDGRGTLFSWSRVQGSLYYNVRVVSADGGVVWQERVENSEWRLPADLHLSANEEYYFRVDAYLTEAKSVSSRHILFRVEIPD